MFTHFTSPDKLPIRLYPIYACNFKCRTSFSTVYCDHQYSIHKQSKDGFFKVTECFIDNKLSNIIKISGREPTLYPEIVGLVQELSILDRKITLSTNGSLSFDLLDKLIDAGVSLFTLSLHSLDKKKYSFMTGLPESKAIIQYNHIKAIIKYIAESGVELHLIKVMLKGFNDSVQELNEFFAYSLENNALAKIFDLNYHENLDKHYLTGKPINSEENNIFFPENIHLEVSMDSNQIMNNLYYDLTHIKEKLKKEAIRIDKFENIYSRRTVYIVELNNKQRILFDEYNSDYSGHSFCSQCHLKSECKEGPYSNGWEIRPDLNLQICPIRDDLIIDFSNVRKGQKLSFKDGILKFE